MPTYSHMWHKLFSSCLIACLTQPCFRDSVADVNDPPDAPEDAAVFMHDISHSAWHQFTRHVAQEAASISGSSFYTAQAVDHQGAEV